jgi:hypothetical protein
MQKWLIPLNKAHETGKVYNDPAFQYFALLPSSEAFELPKKVFILYKIIDGHPGKVQKEHYGGVNTHS